MIIQIDALYLLLLGELSLVLLGVTLYLFANNRKYKALHRKTLKSLEGARGTAEEQSDMETGEGISVEIREEGQAKETFPMEHPPMEELPGMHFPDGAGEMPDDATLAGKVRTLLHIVDFQKGKIIELMCYKDMFESAQGRLSVLQKNYRELQEKVGGLVESSGSQDELSGPIGTLESSNRELESFIKVLEGENETLTGKFRMWEDELKRLWEKAESISLSDGAVPDVTVDDGRHEELLREKEELTVRVKDFEEKMQEKDRLLDELQKQYEDMEKEYMILYNQQQQAQQQQPI